MKTKELTREWLENHGVTVEGTTIYYQGKKGFRELKPVVLSKKHKYGNNKNYLAVGVYLPETQKQTILVVHRIIYAWYKGIAHAGLVIDHIDGNPYNNNIENLREISQPTNLKCREGYGHNNSLYYGMGGLSNEEVDKLKEQVDKDNEFIREKKEASKCLATLLRTMKNDLKLVRLQYAEEKMNIKASNIYLTKEYKKLRESYLDIVENLKDGIKALQKSFHSVVSEYKKREEEIRERLTKIRENDEL